MWGSHDVEVFVFQFHAHLCFRVGEVAGRDDVLPSLVEDDHGRLAVLTPRVGHHFRTRIDEVAEMLVGVIFGGEPHLPRLAVHLHQCVLCPSPGGLAIVGEDEIPVVVFVAAVAYVVGEQEEGVLARLPVHGAVATFALAHHEAEVGVALAHLWQVVAALPLRAYALHVGLQGGVVEDFLHIVQAVGVERAYPQLHLRVAFLERGGQVVVVEAQRALRRPCASGVRCVGVGLVLVHHLRDGQPLLRIEVDEAAEHVGVALEVAGVLDEEVLGGQPPWEHALALAQEFHLVGVGLRILLHVEQVGLPLVHGVVAVGRHGIVVVDFHPCRRTPGAHEELQCRLVFLCRPCQGDDVALVTLDVEVVQHEVAGNVVATVPTAGVVVGVHRHAAMGETQVAVGGEDAVHQFVLVLPREHVEGIPVQFVERGAPGAEHDALLRAVDGTHRPSHCLGGECGFRLCPCRVFRRGVLGHSLSVCMGRAHGNEERQCDSCSFHLYLVFSLQIYAFFERFE